MASRELRIERVNYEKGQIVYVKFVVERRKQMDVGVEGGAQNDKIRRSERFVWLLSRIILLVVLSVSLSFFNHPNHIVDSCVEVRIYPTIPLLRFSCRKGSVF